jgi:hypothetical protein
MITTNFCRQAIVPRYIAPTNHRGARVKATCNAGSVTIPYPYELSGAEPHAVAVRALLEKLQWSGAWVAGGMPNGAGYVFVCIG